MRLALATTLTLGLIGCDQGYNNLELVDTVDDFDQAPSNTVDILWVIDDSTSMKEEQAAVKAAAKDFIAELDGADMDFHIGLVTTDGDSTNAKASSLLGTPTYLTSECKEKGTPCTYGDDFASRVVQGTNGSDMEKGLEVALNAVTPPHSETDNAGFLRPDSLLMVIILSDENDCSDGGRLGDATGEACYTEYDQLTPVSDLVAGLQEAKASQGGGGVVMSGIIGPEAVEGCQFAVPGKRYSDAIKMLGGVEADICLQDYSSIMQSLGLVATGILTNFQLTHAARYTADDPATDADEGKLNPKVEVTAPGADPDKDAKEVVEDATNGWTYLPDYAQIQFNGDAVPERGAHIRVTYYPAGPVPEPPADTTGA